MVDPSWVDRISRAQTLPRLAFLVPAVGILYYVFQSVQHHIKDSELLPLPPGPTGLPLIGNLLNIIGNLLDILREVKVGTQRPLFEIWARQYGELYKLKVGHFTQYMVNSDQAVKAVFGKPAAVSANRPRWIVSNEHIRGQWNVMLLNADTARRRHQRKMTTNHIGSVAKTDAGVPFLEYESPKFMYEVCNDVTIQQSSRKLWETVVIGTLLIVCVAINVSVRDGPLPAMSALHTVDEVSCK